MITSYSKPRPKIKTSCFYFRRADEKEKGKEFFECGRYIKPAFKKEIERTIEYKTYSQEDAQLWVDLQVQKENELYAEFILR